jgi:microcystin-dependent protein
MGAIYNIAGTTSDTFMLNGKLTLFQGDDEPSSYQGTNGDVFYQTNGNIWVKYEDSWHNTTTLSMPQPSDNTGKMLYSNGTNYVPTTFNYSDVALKGEASFTKGAEIFASQPYVDFHYNNSTGDYTSRIIESSNGVLSIVSANSSQNTASSSTTSNVIATQGWVNDPSKSTNVVHRSGTETVSGNKTFTDNVLLAGTATAVTQDISDSSTKLATTAFVNGFVFDKGSVPTGTMLTYSGSSAPSGWLICDGSAISRTTYSSLFGVIGTTYGTGDGSSTFNIPNMKDKTVWGANGNLGTTKSAGLPSMSVGLRTSSGAGKSNGGSYTNGYLCQGYSKYSDNFTTWTNATNYNIISTNSNAVYGNSSTVQPPALCLNFIIKY